MDQALIPYAFSFSPVSLFFFEHPAYCIPENAEIPCYLSVAHAHFFKIPYHSPHLQPVQS
jgi:hypothetical protein